MRLKYLWLARMEDISTFDAASVNGIVRGMYLIRANRVVSIGAFQTTING